MLVESSYVGLLNILHSECFSPTGTCATCLTGRYFGLKCSHGVRARPCQGGVDGDGLTAGGNGGAAAGQGGACGASTGGRSKKAVKIKQKTLSTILACKLIVT